MPRPAVRFPPLDVLDASLAARRPRIPAADAVDAAVMLLLRRRDGAAEELLLCRRAARAHDPWSGHMGLPGGRRAPGDVDALAVAVRETREEVGFDPLAHGRLLGALPVLVARGRRVPRVRVAPFVAVVEEPVEPRLSPEIAAAWWVPTSGLVAARVSVPELALPVPAYLAPVPDGPPAVVWGMTHRMLTMLRRSVAPPPA